MEEQPQIIPSPFNDYWRSLVLNGQELNIDDIPVDVSIDIPVANSEERNEPELESVVINRFTMDDLENDLDDENDQENNNKDEEDIPQPVSKGGRGKG